MRKSLYLSSLATALLLSSCVSVPNTTDCTVAGQLTDGMICSESNTGKSSQLTKQQMVDFLEPQAERPDPDHPGKTLPKRAGATCQSAEDRGKLKTAMETACRELGTHCTFEMKQALKIKD